MAVRQSVCMCVRQCLCLCLCVCACVCACVFVFALVGARTKHDQNRAILLHNWHARLTYQTPEDPNRDREI